MPTIKARKTVRRQIETTNRISKLEEAWGKNPRNELVPISGVRGTSITNLQMEKVSGFRTIIHSHPSRPREFIELFKKRKMGAIPSWPDIYNILGNYYLNDIKSSVIASINISGKVTGYTFMRINSKKFQPDKLEELCKKRMQLKRTPTTRFLLQLEEYGFRTKFVPMAGYRFNEKTGKFEKEKNKK
ncbi:MAG: hypothetical protein Q7S21_02400 [archaeon]|nr:hypothetical protein [archaeon]